MSNRYANINGQIPIKNNYNNINTGFDAVQADMDNNKGTADTHIANQAVHTTQAEHDKLAAIQPGAEVNQNAFQKVNNVQATTKTDTVTFKGGTGITVSTDPVNKEVTVTATGTATPGAHASAHVTGGSDVIPDAIPGSKSGLMSAINAQLVSGQLPDVAPTALSLSPGPQVINVDRPSILRHVGFRGRTMPINILGREGNFETDSNGDGVGDGWTKGPKGTYTLPSGLYGTKGQRVDALTTDTDVTSRWVSKTISVEANSYYVLLCDLTTDGTTSGMIRIESPALGNIDTFSATSKLLAVRFASTVAETITLRLFNRAVVGQTGWVQFDGVRFYQISAADYAAYASMTADQVAAKWPYTEGIVNVDRVWMRKAGKNQLPGTPDSVHANARMNGPYDLSLVATAAFQGSSVDIPIIPGQAYIFSFVKSATAGYAHLDYYNAAGTLVVLEDGIGLNAAAGTYTRTVTVPVTASKAVLHVVLSNSAAGTIRFTNWQLELGSVSTAFTANDDQYVFASPNAGGSVDGSVADQVYTDEDGRFRVLRQFRTVDANGSLPWEYESPYTGFKRVRVLAFPLPFSGSASTQVMQKYDGKPLSYNSATSTSGDQFFVSTSTGNLFVSISSADSGWGDAYTPTADEIKAYFLGWTMFTNPSGSTTNHPDNPANNLYNGTGNKAWVRRQDGVSRIWVDGTTTLPTTQAAGYTPYRLQYQLATPLPPEEIPQEGAITLHAGSNLIEVGTGVVVRERAALQDGQYINTSTIPLKYRLAKFIGVYADRRKDNRWVFKTPSTQASIDKVGLYYADYGAVADPPAVYTVTYIALDTYKLGIAPDSVTADYAPNLRGTVDTLAMAYPDVVTRLDALETGSASKDQPGWITPTLLNGWVAYASDETPGYYKDSTGIVRLGGRIKNGAITRVFVLPPGYRPKQPVFFLCRAETGSGAVAMTLSVGPDGVIFPWDGAGVVSVALSAINFRAEG